MKFACANMYYRVLLQVFETHVCSPSLAVIEHIPFLILKFKFNFVYFWNDGLLLGDKLLILSWNTGPTLYKSRLE